MPQTPGRESDRGHQGFEVARRQVDDEAYPTDFIEVIFHLWTPPFHARENVGVVFARGRMLSSVRPMMRQEDSRRPVWEFADRVQITRSVLEALWKALVVPAPSRRLLRHTLLPLTPTPSRSWSAYAAIIGVL